MKEEVKEPTGWDQFDEIRLSATTGGQKAQAAGYLVYKDKSIKTFEDAKRVFKEFALTYDYIQMCQIKRVKLSIFGWTNGKAPVLLESKLVGVPQRKSFD